MKDQSVIREMIISAANLFEMSYAKVTKYWRVDSDHIDPWASDFYEYALIQYTLMFILPCEQNRVKIANSNIHNLLSMLEHRPDVPTLQSFFPQRYSLADAWSILCKKKAEYEDEGFAIDREANCEFDESVLLITSGILEWTKNLKKEITKPTNGT